MKIKKKQLEYIIFILGLFILLKINLKTSYDDLIKRISKKHGNDWNLVKAIIKVESNFKPNAHRKTKYENSRGLGQVNEKTALLHELDPNKLFNPDYNIEAINLILDDLKTRYTNDMDLLASYNAGSVKVNKQGFYINSSYVINAYSRFLIYTVFDF